MLKLIVEKYILTYVIIIEWDDKLINKFISELINKLISELIMIGVKKIYLIHGPNNGKNCIKTGHN